MTRLPGFSATTALPVNNFCFISTTCSSDDFFNPIMRYHQPAPVGAGFQFLKSGISPAILKNDHFRGVLLRLPPAGSAFRVAISPAILKNNHFRGVLLRLPLAGSAFRVALSPAILKNSHFRGVFSLFTTKFEKVICGKKFPEEAQSYLRGISHLSDIESAIKAAKET
ncbi:MAG: hypothetical protein IIT72_03195 [Lachnospiraceae bacterium]|nr:hypothetical protein [Lachnospiraceae bacterium]